MENRLAMQIMHNSMRQPIILTLVLLSAWLSSGSISAQEKIKFPVGVGTKTVGTNMFWLAAKKGFFDDVGLDVQPILLRGTPITVQALVSESLYLALGSADAVITAAANGADLVGVGGVVNGLTQTIVAGKSYKSFKDLRGATVGVQALTSGAANVLQRIFKQNGLDYPADYKLLAVGGGSFNLAALISGQLGATYLVVPLDYTAEQQGFNVLGNFRDYFHNYQLSLLTVKRSWAEKNRALLVRYLKATLRAHRWLYGNKAAAIDYLATEIPLNTALAKRGWECFPSHRFSPPKPQ